MQKNKMFRMSVLATVVTSILAVSPAIAASKPGAHGTTRNLAAASGEQSFARFIINYRDGAKEKSSKAAAVQGAAGALKRAGLDRAAGNQAAAKSATSVTYLRKLAIGADLVRTSRNLDRVEAEAFMRQLAADPNVASVTIDHKRQAVRDIAANAKALPTVFTPNDTYFGEDQWNLKAHTGTVTQNGAANFGGTNVDSAWDLADGSGVVIAVLDTGITAHPDIDTSLASAGYDFISDAYTSGRANDDRAPGGWDPGDWTNAAPYTGTCQRSSASSWHGTHVASTAGAELTNNGVGEAGIAYGAKILPVRVLGHCGGYDSDINDAIVWAAGGHVDGVPDNANPAKIINLSLGGAGACPATDPAAIAIAQANALGATVVVAAGNDNSDVANFSPASCPGAISVAATGITSRRAYYSNYGTRIDIAAPGGGVYVNDGSSGTQAYDGFIWQALNLGTTVPTTASPTAAYGGFAGTSQATPHVSGVIALMQGARLDAGQPLLTPTEVLSYLKATAYAPSVAPAANRPIGAGILDAKAAVDKALETPCDPQTETCGPVATPLENKVAVTGLSGAGEILYSFEAKAGGVLSFTTYGGTGNVSVYVSFGAEPTTTTSDAKSTRVGNSETVRFNTAQAGTYYIKLVGAPSYTGVTLTARQ